MPKYVLHPPTQVKGVHIDRFKALYLIYCNGKRYDSFLYLSNAKKAIARYIERDLENA